MIRLKSWLRKTTYGSGRVAYTDEAGKEYDVWGWQETGRSEVDAESGMLTYEVILPKMNNKRVWLTQNMTTGTLEPDGFKLELT